MLYILAVMSKPTSTPIPVVLLLLDFWPLRRLDWRTAVEKAPFLLIAGFSVIITLVSQRHLELAAFRAFSAGQTLLLICHNLVFYPSHMIWPVHLSSVYPFPEAISLSNGLLLTSVVVTVGMSLLLVVSLCWTRALVISWLCFAFLVAPTLLNKSYSPSVAWDKYAYLPAVGLLLILARVVERSWRGSTNGKRGTRRIALAGAVLVAAVLLTRGTRLCLAEWQTTERHNLFILATAPDSPDALIACGKDRNARGDHDEAIAYYTRALERRPNSALGLYNLGNALADKGDLDSALREYSKAIELAPNVVWACNNRGLALFEKGDYDGAIRDLTRVIDLQPDAMHAYNNRASAWRAKGDYDRAILDYNKAVELKPGCAETYYNRGLVYGQKGDYQQAIRDYSKAIEFRPAFADAYEKRARACCSLRQYDQAWADVRLCRRFGGNPAPEFIRKLAEVTGRTE